LRTSSVGAAYSDDVAPDGAKSFFGKFSKNMPAYGAGENFNREPREIRERLVLKSFRVFGVFRG
jgi:hypothetical protein